MSKKNFKEWMLYLYSFLFSIYPILFLYSYNIDEVGFDEVLLSIAIVLVVVFLLISFLKKIIKNEHPVYLIVNLFVVFFFFYGHLFHLLNENKMLSLAPVSHLYLFLVLLLFFIGGVFCICRFNFNLKRVSNITSRIVLALYFLLFVTFLNNVSLIFNEEQKCINNNDNNKDGNISERTPNIYYIILDGYAGNDVLKEIYNFDNSKFFDELKKAGFFIGEKSKSNYAHTFLSLASSLNMNYLQNTREFNITKKDVLNLIKSNRVYKTLKEKGYRIIHFNSGVIFNKDNPDADINIDCGKLNEFSISLLRSTILLPFMKELGFLDLSRKRILNTFEKIEELEEIKERKFVFAHIMAPHPPYLFNKDGSTLAKADLRFKGDIWKDKNKYLNQLFFINKKVTALIDKIKMNSKNESIIILQADHGSASLLGSSNNASWNKANDRQIFERFSILNAVYFPDNEYSNLYKSITPVNTFRIIFNKYFKQKNKILKDKQFFSSYKSLFNFKDVSKK